MLRGGKPLADTLPPPDPPKASPRPSRARRGPILAPNTPTPSLTSGNGEVPVQAQSVCVGWKEVHGERSQGWREPREGQGEAFACRARGPRTCRRLARPAAPEVNGDPPYPAAQPPLLPTAAHCSAAP